MSREETLRNTSRGILLARRRLSFIDAASQIVYMMKLLETIHQMYDRVFVVQRGTVLQVEAPEISLPSRKEVHEYLSISCTDPLQQYGKFFILCAVEILDENFRGDKDLLVVSDGSEINVKMIFGSVVAAQDALWLESGSRQVPSNGTSNCAEAGVVVSSSLRVYFI